MSLNYQLAVVPRLFMGKALGYSKSRGLMSKETSGAEMLMPQLLCGSVTGDNIFYDYELFAQRLIYCGLF